MLVKLVIIAAILYIIHISMEKYVVKDNSKGGWSIISAVVWLGSAAATICAVAYAVIGG